MLKANTVFTTLGECPPRKREPIEVGGIQFKTQKALGEYLREIRARYSNGATVQPPDDAFMYHAIQRHVDWREKFGSISKFIVDHDDRGSQCFYAVTTSGARISFAVDACVTGRARDPDQDSRCAARDAVEYQVMGFRDGQFNSGLVACAVCLEAVTPETCHVDHRLPFTFKRLWEIFKQQNPELDLTAVNAMTKPGRRKFGDQQTELKWLWFHREYARLRITCKRCNLSTSR